MPAPWVVKEQEEPFPQSSMVETRYRLFCPACKSFQPHVVSVAGEDGASRVTECVTCGLEALFESYESGRLVPPGFAKAAHRYAGQRAFEILSQPPREERE